jgi:ribonucleoside-diphosphate reductase beta chain
MKNDLLNPGFELTLRPMRYPQFFEMFKAGIRNTWNTDELDLSSDIADLNTKLTPAERHMVERLVAFFATGDTIVANNLVLNLYKHLNSPELRMWLLRQWFDEALHIQTYLLILDTYLPNPDDRSRAFAAVENIPSIRAKAEFCFRWIDSIQTLEKIETDADRKSFILNAFCFANCIEGLFFYGAFAYVYFLRSRGLLNGLADATNWVFRDESLHMEALQEAVRVIRQENPHLFDADLETSIRTMVDEAIECEYQFAQDVLSGGVSGMSLKDMRTYLQYVGDQRLSQMGYAKTYNVANPFDFMVNQDTQGVANFFERRNSSYQVGVVGSVDLDQDF